MYLQTHEDLDSFGCTTKSDLAVQACPKEPFSSKMLYVNYMSANIAKWAVAKDRFD